MRRLYDKPILQSVSPQSTGGFSGVIAIDYGNGIGGWADKCPHVHETREEATDCARKELKARIELRAAEPWGGEGL